MDEDMGYIDLVDMDLLGLEDAYKNNTLHAITPKKIQLLSNILQSSRTRTKLGIIIRNPNKTKKIIKESKNRGHKKYIQRITTLVTRLVESRQYSHRKEFFSSNSNVNQ